MPRPVPLPTAPLTLPHCRPATGRDVLSALLASAHTTFDEIRRGCPDRRVAAMGTVRGTGPGVSFAELAGILERDHPVELRYPFEGSEHVGGAAGRRYGAIAALRDFGTTRGRENSGTRRQIYGAGAVAARADDV